MPNAPETTRALPFLTDFPDKDRRLFEAAAAQQDERRRKADDSRARKADRVVEDHRRQLRDLLGAANLAELRAAVRRERIAFRDLSQPPAGLDRNRAAQNKARKRKLDALLKKLGANPDRLKKLGLASGDALLKVLAATDAKAAPGFHLANNLDRWTRLSPLHMLPLPWGFPPIAEDPNDPHRWFLFRPPFFGFLFRFAPQASSNFRVDRELFLHPPSALAGNVATMDCGDADDIDYASATCESQIAFGFVAPTAGLVEVLIDAQSTIGTHFVGMEDEWGWSESWTNQTNSLMMNVLHPNVPVPSLADMSRFRAEFDGDDSTHSRQNLVRGQHYYAQLFSSGPVAGGQHVVVSVGTRTFDIAFSNDTEVHSRSNFQWFINSVEVRIAP